ncbi:MAG: hypothetical protein QXX08_06325 [Candidatus Bathyarchaeia archaeon]
MKVCDNSTVRPLIIGTLVLVLGILFLRFILLIDISHISGNPKNCGELGQEYLEMAIKQYAVNDFGSTLWQEIVERETLLVNLCYEKFSFEEK